MKKVVGIRFKDAGKIYFFDPENKEVKKDDYVIVETSVGQELGKVSVINRNLGELKLETELKKIIRIATKADIEHNMKNKEKEKKAFDTAIEKISEYKLDMKLVDVEYTFDNSKLLFYFIADGRIDFRDIVKELAMIFKTRIELRQIGVRDEVKKIGGNGVCGRELCCCSFLNDFEAVSIKMAKEQNLSLNPAKISGNCGRLMCCLKYEEDVYKDKIKRLPKIGAHVKTEDGKGTIQAIETLKEIVRVKVEDEKENTFFSKKYKIEDVEVIDKK